MTWSSEYAKQIMSISLPLVFQLAISIISWEFFISSLNIMGRRHWLFPTLCVIFLVWLVVLYGHLPPPVLQWLAILLAREEKKKFNHLFLKL